MNTKLGSILLDSEPARRGDITLVEGRIWCDGNDITPGPEPVGLVQAYDDIRAMYGSAVWKLELEDGSQAV